MYSKPAAEGSFSIATGLEAGAPEGVERDEPLRAVRVGRHRDRRAQAALATPRRTSERVARASRTWVTKPVTRSPTAISMEPTRTLCSGPVALESHRLKERTT